MIAALCHLGTDDLRQLAAALRSGRLAAPFTKLALGRYLTDSLAERVAGPLAHLTQGGLDANQIATMLDLLAADRDRRLPPDDLIDLVWTGPETGGVASRDTSVVVRDLFGSVQHSVLLAGYAVHQGQSIFRTLAERMDRDAALQVTMYLDVHRPYGDTSSPTEILRHFADRFRRVEWPGQRLPEVYHDPRSLEPDGAKRASLHAKCLVIDATTSFVSSANFTEAAHLRNIEVGLLVHSQPLARRLTQHFVALAAEGILRRVPLGRA